MIKFDVIFVDVTSPEPYESGNPGLGQQGGTERTVMRIAESLGKIGLNVAVLQRFEFEPILGQHCLYMPISWIKNIEATCAVHLRNVATLELTPNSKNFVWCHDTGIDKLREWTEKIVTANATVVPVSEFHKQNLDQYLKAPKYCVQLNPIDSRCYSPLDARPKYDPYQLVWMSSPHKGLEGAVGSFKKLRKKSPKSKLLVFNPGYVKDALLNEHNIHVMGTMPQEAMWKEVSKSMCVFYPTTFEEAGCLVAGEANALGVPFAGYKVGALPEMADISQLSNNEDELIDKVLKWQNGERPVMVGQERLRLRNVIKNWVGMLNGGSAKRIIDR